METTTAGSPGLAVARIVLKPRKALPFFGRHPWVLASAIDRIEPLSTDLTQASDLDGQVVDLVSDKGKFVARGIYNSRSRIAMRLYTWHEDELLDAAFFHRRLEGALALRRQIGYAPEGSQRRESAARLVFSEADGVSGLVVDRYGDCLVVQPTSLGMAQRVPAIVEILQSLVEPQAVVVRAEKSMAELEGFEPDPAQVIGNLPDGPLTIREHGVAYEVDLQAGQKTGFYLDQRENRLAAARYVRGRKVLDMFCYTGGFSLAAAKIGGAAQVFGIDGSKKAVAQAQRNAQRNGLSNVQFDCADGFKSLEVLVERGETFDVVILDPPKFARGRGGANQALRAYHRINRAAVQLLVRGGFLLTCSCTGGVTRDDFLLMLSGVAQKSGRDIRIVEQRGAAPDHPVAATCLETEYLKCLICEIS